ncbi:sensor domain-containing phosphodiesterase [Microbaculum marinum]|uniref:EAL domain-containing protein n=1 Tax=Microbaculum marinum TaxID=1764581 RepID=A0AAW9RQ07_9HYPH
MDEGDTVVRQALKVMREHLGMEAAYISEIVDGRSVFRVVDAPGQEHLIKVGDSHALEDVYCPLILDGRLPELIPDTADEPLAVALPITAAVPIGAHVSVPLRLSNGRVYGMFCCLSFKPDKTLNKRDHTMMRAFADLAAREIGRDLDKRKHTDERLARISEVIRENRFSIVYQPIWDLESRRPVGLECLTRFTAEPLRSPDRWFEEAASAGMGVDLEMATLKRAVAVFPQLPPGTHLSINASPETVNSEAFQNLMTRLPAERFVLEITEHALIDDYASINARLKPLRERGLRIAVDDAGAGYSCLQHILQLLPNIIKLDMSLTRNINVDPVRRALTAALVGFSVETGSRIVAEGVESMSELNTLTALGVQKGQGYLLGRPVPFAAALGNFEKYGFPHADCVAASPRS